MKTQKYTQRNIYMMELSKQVCTLQIDLNTFPEHITDSADKMNDTEFVHKKHR